MAMTQAEREEYANIFVAAMTPELERRDAEIAAMGAASEETKALIARVDARMTELETKGKRPQAVDGRLAPDAEQKAMQMHAFLDWARMGRRAEEKSIEFLKRAGAAEAGALDKGAQILQGETKAFSLSDSTLGGYFVLPDIIQDEIIKAQILFSPVRQLAKVQQTQNNEVEIPVRKATLTAGWIAETGTRTESLGQSYGRSVIPTHEMYAYVIFSRQVLEDSYFDLQAALLQDIAEQFAVLEGAAFVTGNGVGQPLGFLSNVTSNVVTATGSGTMAYGDIVKTFFKLKPLYRSSPTCKWVMNQAVLSTLRQLLDSNGRPIFQPYSDSGLSEPNPGTILGKSYVEATDMPSTLASTNRYLAVGDFSKAYRFIDRVTMSVQRLEELLALSGQVALIVHKRVGGQLVLEESLSVLKNS